jgi:GNAT superfamily N-acetyltransferase
MSQPLEIREQVFKDFFEVPFLAYGRSSPFVSLFKDDMKRFLDDRKNPLFSHFGKRTYFTAYRDGKPLGRITAHLHEPSNQRHGWKRSYFGYFDCADDLEIARALLNRAEDWGRSQGCTEILGNFNLTAMQQIGVMTEGFENIPYTDMVYSPPHIAKLLEQCGYERQFPMTTFELDLKNCDPDSILSSKHRELLKNPEYQWDRLVRKRMKEQLSQTCQLLNDGFDQNPMFVPLTEEEFMFQAKDMMLIIDERISSIVYRNGKPLGVAVCIPDLNPFLKEVDSRMGFMAPFKFLKHRARRKRAVIIFYSVSRAAHGLGIGTLLLRQCVQSLRQAGYESVGITWVWDENKGSLMPIHKLGFRELHRLHLFRKSLA